MSDMTLGEALGIAAFLREHAPPTGDGSISDRQKQTVIVLAAAYGRLRGALRAYMEAPEFDQALFDRLEELAKEPDIPAEPYCTLAELLDRLTAERGGWDHVTTADLDAVERQIIDLHAQSRNTAG